MQCDYGQCQNPAVFAYVWPWGEEGRCCAEHRSFVEGQASQLNRAIQFFELDESEPRKKYSAPTLTPLPTELGALRMRVAELGAQLTQRDEEIAELKRRLADARGETSVDDEKPPTVPPLAHAATTPSRKDPDEHKRSQRK